MVAQPVEFVLVVYYGPAAHHATYGRFSGTTYTKDYIQLSRSSPFLATASDLFATDPKGTGSLPLTFHWPAGSSPGFFEFESADRPHLAWPFNSAPDPWRMSLSPHEDSAYTIPGDPTHTDSSAADREYRLLAGRGAGQPYLMAVKLRREPAMLHLRAYLDHPSQSMSWADIALAPSEIQALAASTSQQSALKWKTFDSGGVVPTEEVLEAVADLLASENLNQTIEVLSPATAMNLAAYIRDPARGLFFDPEMNHDAWQVPSPIPPVLEAIAATHLSLVESRFATVLLSDATAENAPVDSAEVEQFRQQIEDENYSVPNKTVTTKTRGSAQKAFAKTVKQNYGGKCAVTGIASAPFLVASHIVPWSEDETIRVDPSNGICLSILVDRAFENGLLVVEDDLALRIDWQRVGEDEPLREYLEPYDGKKLASPTSKPPKPEYLKRRRDLVNLLIPAPGE